MDQRVREWGSAADGTPVRGLAIANAAGLAIEVIDYGATLVSVQAAGVELTLGYDSLAGWLKNPAYFGATVGRFANRIAGGRFTVDGVDYRLPLNRPGVHLHGGPGGFCYRPWTMEPIAGDDYAGASFSRISSDGEEGYPGELQVRVSIVLTEQNALVFDYWARSTKVTPINLTNHCYWNLCGDGNGDILGHRLQLAADEFLELDAMLVPTGRVLPVGPTGSPMDFRAPKAIGDDIAAVPGGYDHCFVLDRSNTAAHPCPVPAAWQSDQPTRWLGMVEAPRCSRRMELWTTKPAVQFYAGNMLDGGIGRNGRSYTAHTGLCLETQYYPDAPNHANFPSCLLAPGEDYHHTTIHRFSW